MVDETPRWTEATRTAVTVFLQQWLLGPDDVAARAEQLLNHLADAGLLVEPDALLRSRLEAAERACVLLGWVAAPGGSERSDAALQAWLDWSHLPGVPRPRPVDPEWAQLIGELAARRRATREATLARILGQQP